jgi:hypothetical protein
MEWQVMPRILRGDFFCVWSIPEALMKGLNGTINGDLCLSPMITKAPIKKKKKKKNEWVNAKTRSASRFLGRARPRILMVLSLLKADGLVEIPYISDLSSI